MNGVEFSIVWRWKTDQYRDEFSDERRKSFKTEKGALRLLAKLQSKGGRYEHTYEVENTTYDDGYRMDVWTLDYARMERRTVVAWEPVR